MSLLLYWTEVVRVFELLLVMFYQMHGLSDEKKILCVKKFSVNANIHNEYSNNIKEYVLKS